MTPKDKTQKREKYSFDFEPGLRARAEASATKARRHLGPQLHVLLEAALDAEDAAAREVAAPEAVLAAAEQLLDRTNRG